MRVLDCCICASCGTFLIALAYLCSMPDGCIIFICASCSVIHCTVDVLQFSIREFSWTVQNDFFPYWFVRAVGFCLFVMQLLRGRYLYISGVQTTDRQTEFCSSAQMLEKSPLLKLKKKKKKKGKEEEEKNPTKTTTDEQFKGEKRVKMLACVKPESFPFGWTLMGSEILRNMKDYLFSKWCDAAALDPRSKHIKDSKECYLLRQDKTSNFLGGIPLSS